jgi:hypothetical protein
MDHQPRRLASKPTSWWSVNFHSSNSVPIAAERFSSLGLSASDPVGVLVIDHIEKPDPN